MPTVSPLTLRVKGVYRGVSLKRAPECPVLTKAHSRTVGCCEDIIGRSWALYGGVPVFPVWSDTDPQ